ncbi:MAG: conjugal transfer protein TraN [Legionella sp.]|uniref:conjugal transfer protein TraN n=1 Tax=Legionella sp. TaxID=459 RepID=UPI0039E26B1D
MSAKRFLLIGLLSGCALAANKQDAMNARDRAMNALRGLNPSAILPNFTEHPKEQSLETKQLKNLSINSLPNNATAQDIYRNAGNHAARLSENSPEVRYAEQLLENPEDALNGACYTKNVECIEKASEHSCLESIEYKELACADELKVSVQPLSQTVTRTINASPYSSESTIDLSHCAKGDWHCSEANLIQFHEHCEAVDISVTTNNKARIITQKPTCAEHTLKIKKSYWEQQVKFTITLTQKISDDEWLHRDCDRIQTQTHQGQCFIKAANKCLDANQTRWINGVMISRPCWKQEYHYQCMNITNSGCTGLMNQGCSQIGSQCSAQQQSQCTQYTQKFRCLEEQCLPEKTICPGTMACADGQCDESQMEESSDASEGISRLGALAGAAGDVAANQIRSGIPAIFKGKNSTCRKVFLNARNCCGGSHQMTHCSQDEKRLAKAKEEGRAFRVGEYCAKKVIGCVEKKESWCVFPNSLAAIIQIQGRFKQLGISFGWAKDNDNEANCRGITPEELERINFSSLDMSRIEKEFVDRMTPPSNGQISQANQSRIVHLQNLGKAHD